VRVGVLDAFMATWSNARETFGEGVPQTGERFDQSGPLNQLKTTVESAQGYIDGHPGAVSQFQNVSVPGGTVNFVDANGHINWDTVNQFRPQFDQVLESPGMAETRNWDDGNHGYESGLNDTNVDPKSLPDPADSRDAPAPPRK
jgi:hypothetical protein